MNARELRVMLALVAVMLSARAAVAAKAKPPVVSTFALVLGVNRSVDEDAALLRYADDDAARFRDLFQAVGAKTFVLTRMDENTRRVHPATEAEVAPRMAAVESAVAQLARAVAAARARGERAVFYFVYAGHGKVAGQSGYIALEDARLTGPDLLARIIDPVAADETHLVVDACHSVFLVLDRGPGGTRRALSGFAQLGALARRPDIGFLLSTSSARESHEWAAFQAGVFSHEVRSGLYGAADADGDGVVSYLEIAAFVKRANASVPNERYRPEVFARPPGRSATLLDLRSALTQRIEVDDAYRGHHYIEDTAGVRLADFHNGGKVRLMRPSPERLYLRRAAEDREYVLPPAAGILRTAELVLQDSRVGARGAANDAFNTLFALPFGADVVASYRPPEDEEVRPAPEVAVAAEATRSGISSRTLLGSGLAVAGAAGIATGVAALMSASSLRAHIKSDDAQDAVAAANAQITARNRLGGVLLGVGGAALLGGAAMLLWPDAPAQVTVSRDGLMAGWRGSF
jgi:hypothetical protein